MTHDPSRRTLLGWLGSSATLPLVHPLLLAACKEGDGHTGAYADELEFAPGDPDDPAWEDWPVRTVDHQELATILASWRLVVDGMVDTPLELSFADLLALERLDVDVDFHCVEGWSIYDVPWNGVHLSTLLQQVGVRSEATHLTFHTMGGKYNESLPLDVAIEPRTLLALGVDGRTLPLERGFPLRLVVPRLYGYKSAKYIERIELTDEPVLGYWEQRGYGYDAEVAESRLREGKY